MRAQEYVKYDRKVKALGRVFFYIDRFHCHATKKNKLKTIQWKKLRNWDVIEDKKIRHLKSYHSAISLNASILGKDSQI